jgi:hypothetical protein
MTFMLSLGFEPLQRRNYFIRKFYMKGFKSVCKVTGKDYVLRCVYLSVLLSGCLLEWKNSPVAG